MKLADSSKNSLGTYMQPTDLFWEKSAILLAHIILCMFFASC